MLDSNHLRKFYVITSNTARVYLFQQLDEVQQQLEYMGLDNTPDLQQLEAAEAKHSSEPDNFSDAPFYSLRDHNTKLYIVYNNIH